MRCPKCTSIEDKVIDSRIARDGNTIRRRRECLECSHRFTTTESLVRDNLVVVKRDGRTEPFDARHSQTRSQDLEPAYYDAGQFYWGRTESWLQGLDIHRNGRTIVMPGWRAVDIDTPDDWLRAEALVRELRQPPGQESA